MHRRAGFVALAVFAVVVLGVAPTFAEGGGRLKVGDLKSYAAETPHPYPKAWSDRVFSPGAEWVRVHFTGLHLAEGDSLTVSSPDGAQVWTYSGKGPHGNGDVWAFAIDGDTAIVELRGGRGNGHGYKIDAIAHGTVQLNPRKRPIPEVVCGTDGREDSACHTADATYNTAQRPVTRLLFQSGGFFYVCTGWLATGSNANTLVTNNHCISTQNEASSLQASFNFQRTTCGGGTNGTVTDYAGGTLLKTNNKLDYTLMTLQGNPEATWGELTPTTLAAPVGTVMWFIQHPGGNEKEVGWFENSGGGPLCDVELINQSYAGTTRRSQMAYACDSEGGSSGSPIVRVSSTRVIGLHHFGGVSSNPCRNAATEMPEICSNAGSLLSCVSN